MRIRPSSITLAACVLLGSGCGLFVNFDDYQDEPALGQGGGAGDASVDTAAGGKAGSGGSSGQAGASGKGGTAGKSGGAGTAGGSGAGGIAGSAGTGGAAGTAGTAGNGGAAAGTAGVAGTAGTGGAAGTAGTGGAAGTAGTGGAAGTAGTGGTVGTCSAGSHCDVAVDPGTWGDNGTVTVSGLQCTKASVQLWNADTITQINTTGSTCSWSCIPHDSFCSEQVECSTSTNCTTTSTTTFVYSHQCTQVGGGAIQFCKVNAHYSPTCDVSDVIPNPAMPDARKSCTVASTACNGSGGACVEDSANCVFSNNTMAQCPIGYGNAYVFYQSVVDNRCNSMATCGAATCLADGGTVGEPLAFNDTACLNPLSHTVLGTCEQVGALSSLWLPNAPSCASGSSSSANGQITGSQGKKICCKSPVP
ncbi:MAG: hypothetical protein HY898_10265 [Deltaproteobacteria bacterium]|nr:hypothetical protein [Deltaproteobacteria bacterium]